MMNRSCSLNRMPDLSIYSSDNTAAYRLDYRLERFYYFQQAAKQPTRTSRYRYRIHDRLENRYESILKPEDQPLLPNNHKASELASSGKASVVSIKTSEASARPEKQQVPRDNNPFVSYESSINISQKPKGGKNPFKEDSHQRWSAGIESRVEEPRSFAEIVDQQNQWQTENEHLKLQIASLLAFVDKYILPPLQEEREMKSSSAKEIFERWCPQSDTQRTTPWRNPFAQSCFDATFEDMTFDQQDMCLVILENDQLKERIADLHDFFSDNVFTPCEHYKSHYNSSDQQEQNDAEIETTQRPFDRVSLGKAYRELWTKNMEKDEDTTISNPINNHGINSTRSESEGHPLKITDCTPNIVGDHLDKTSKPKKKSWLKRIFSRKIRSRKDQ